MSILWGAHPLFPSFGVPLLWQGHSRRNFHIEVESFCFLCCSVPYIFVKEGSINSLWLCLARRRKSKAPRRAARAKASSLGLCRVVREEDDVKLQFQNVFSVGINRTHLNGVNAAIYRYWSMPIRARFLFVLRASSSIFPFFLRVTLLLESPGW